MKPGIASAPSASRTAANSNGVVWVDGLDEMALKLELAATMEAAEAAVAAAASGAGGTCVAVSAACDLAAESSRGRASPGSGSSSGLPPPPPPLPPPPPSRRQRPSLVSASVMSAPAAIAHTHCPSSDRSGRGGPPPPPPLPPLHSHTAAPSCKAAASLPAASWLPAAPPAIARSLSLSRRGATSTTTRRPAHTSCVIVATPPVSCSSRGSAIAAAEAREAAGVTAPGVQPPRVVHRGGHLAAAADEPHGAACQAAARRARLRAH
eukprot:scaffold22554_cov63-Phaeocystis_antarctica.AAC.7